MRKALFLTILIASVIAFIPVTGFSYTCDTPLLTDLIAGGGNEASANVVGNVEVCDDGVDLYVTYVITDPETCLLETHLQVSDSLTGIPQTKKGNPIPGKFDDAMEHDCVTEFAYTIPLNSNNLFIAAHSVVQMSSSVTAETCSSVVEASVQGLGKDGSTVLAARSNPDSAIGEPEGYVDGDEFFSLGFGGEIILSFDSLVGGEMGVYEVTNGSSYPLETAQISVSRNGEDWDLLGEAENRPLPGISGSVENMFQLGKCISYVKIVDTSDASPHASNADAFDLDAVCASYSCEEETAWASGTGFPGKNWATYFNYCTQKLVDTVEVSSSGSVVPSNLSLESGKTYTIEASGTYRFVAWGDAGIADANCSLRKPAQIYSYHDNGVNTWVPGSSLVESDQVKYDTYGDVPNFLELWVDGAPALWGDSCYESTHTYSFDMVGNAKTVDFSIKDDNYGDNSGSLFVDIYETCPGED